MAFKLVDEIEVEIRLTFSKVNRQPSSEITDISKDTCRNHTKLTIKYLNVKWNISSLESCGTP